MKTLNILAKPEIKRITYDVILILIGFLLFTTADKIRYSSIDKKTNILVNESILTDLLEIEVSMGQAKKMIAEEAQDGLIKKI